MEFGCAVASLRGRCGAGCSGIEAWRWWEALRAALTPGLAVHCTVEGAVVWVADITGLVAVPALSRGS